MIKKPKPYDLVFLYRVAKFTFSLLVPTGSGKTEMLFYPMAYALSQKKKVCFSSPRTDVILEILPRLISVFPQLPIGVFYGGSKVRDFAAPLILSTTHQLMRFHQMFDVCILDESDAFPYRIDSTLKFSLQNALKMQHTLIYCTATPEPTLLKTLKKINVPIVFVAKRFHGRPLEVPHFFFGLEIGSESWIKVCCHIHSLFG